MIIEIVNKDKEYPFRNDEFVIVPIGANSEEMFCGYERITSTTVRFRAHAKGKKKYGKYLIGVFTPYSGPAAPKEVKVPIFIDPMVRNYG